MEGEDEEDINENFFHISTNDRKSSNVIVWANQGFLNSKEFSSFARSIKMAAKSKPALFKQVKLIFYYFFLIKIRNLKLYFIEKKKKECANISESKPNH